MKTTKIITLALIVAVSVFATSCKKEELPTPEPEESNVQSIIMNTNSSAWKLEGASYKAKLMVPAIDQNVLAFGAVNVFIGDGTGYSWNGMPSVTNNCEFRYSVYLNHVEVEALKPYNQSNFTNPGNQQFKVVIFK